MNKKILTFGLLLGAFFFALVLGSNVASADYEILSSYVVVGVSLYFIFNGWRNVWWFTALLVFSGVVFSHGFIFDHNHLFVAMLVFAFVVSAVNSDFGPKSLILYQAGSRKVTFFIGLVVFYGILHFSVNLALPYSAADYSFKQSIKAYFETYATMATTLWLLTGPYRFQIKEQWDRTFVLILLMAVIGNTMAKGSLFLQGFQATDSAGSGSLQEYFLYVPVINMQAGIYTLRELCPIAAVILGMLVSTPRWWSERTLSMKVLIVAGFMCILLGAMLGGGRATFPFCLGLLGVVTLVRKKIGLLMGASGGILLIIIMVNIFSGPINDHAPFSIARSLQMLMIDKGDTSATISQAGGDDDARAMAFQEGFVQWKKDNRTLVFGRSVFSFDEAAALDAKNRLGNWGFVINAMRAGRTHNLITDLLLQYGIIGAVIYFSGYIAVIFFLIRLARTIPDELFSLKAIVGAIAIYTPFIFVYQLFGGRYLPVVVPLVLGIARAVLVKYEREKQAAMRENFEEADGIGGMRRVSNSR